MAKILDLKLQLQTAKKGRNSCQQYLQQLQATADRLRSIGTDVPDQELVLYALQGLGTDYDNFVTAVSMRYPPPSMIEFSSLLLTHEARIPTNLRATSTTAVHFTTTDGSNSQSFACYANHSNSQMSFNHPNFTPHPSNRGRGYRGRGNQRGRDRGRQTNNNSDAVTCQICSKWGHRALDCYHRFNIKYTEPSPSPSPSPQALVAEPVPVSAAAASSASPSVPWYIDFGASTHVTSDFNNMTSYLPYSGIESVHIGNGSGLKIAHKGISFLTTAGDPLKLNNVLRVPAITKNLLSVSQLVLDNDVLIEFTS